MTRTTVLSLAAAFGFAATLTAQSTTSTTAGQRDRMNDRSGHEVTITGCLSRSADGTYMLTNARMDKPGSTTTTGTTGTTTAGTTTATTDAAKGDMDHAMTWKLEGSDLEHHVGHKIQVTGKTTWSANSTDRSRPDTETAQTTTPPTTTTGTTGSDHPKLDVTSLKMVASSCS